MHRTQILLEERQYQALMAWARRADKSLSELVRAAVERLLGGRKGKGRASRLRDLRAVARDPGGPAARDHDRLLYG